jgi:hypothetical protein
LRAALVIVRAAVLLPLGITGIGEADRGEKRDPGRAERA